MTIILEHSDIQRIIAQRYKVPITAVTMEQGKIIVTDDEMVSQEKVAESRHEYMRQWRAKNKDKVKANNARYWAKKSCAINNESIEGEV